MNKKTNGHKKSYNSKMEQIDEDMCLRIKEQYIKTLKCSFSDLPEMCNVADEGVCMFAIKFDMPEHILNGYRTKSGLINYAFSSSEISKNEHHHKKYLNLFEITIRNKNNYKGNGKHKFNGDKTIVQEYLNLLKIYGVDITEVHFNLFNDSDIVSIHYRNIGMHPVKFARKTAKALRTINITKQK